MPACTCYSAGPCTSATCKKVYYLSYLIKELLNYRALLKPYLFKIKHRRLTHADFAKTVHNCH